MKGTSEQTVHKADCWQRGWWKVGLRGSPQFLCWPLLSVPQSGQNMPLNAFHDFSWNLVLSDPGLSLSPFPTVADFSAVLMTRLSVSFSWQFGKRKWRGLYSISSTRIPSLLTASALQIFIDIIMSPLAIIYPSGNSTSLCIEPHKSTPPAPVIISLLLSELSRVCGHLNKVPQTEGSFLPTYWSNPLPPRRWYMVKRHCGLVDAIVEFKLILTSGCSSLQNVFCAVAARVPLLLLLLPPGEDQK